MATALALPASAAHAYESARASFSLRRGADVFPYRITSWFVLPGEEVSFEAVGGVGPVEATAMAGQLVAARARHWSWRAPGKTGVQTIRVLDAGTGDSMQVNVFVMRAYDPRAEKFSGYRIGTYPKPPPGESELQPPAGLIEVSEADENFQVSPHFRLKQFLCKQAGGYPKFVALKEALLPKLETILEALNASGHSCEALGLLSGYRTPFYNRVIGNVPYSRHLWGAAADVFVDEDGDGRMDDLNRDGRSDDGDGDVFYRILDRLSIKSLPALLFGGLARYRGTEAHGAFGHVDVRSQRARWSSP